MTPDEKRIVDWDTIPHTRKVGRYFFFAYCALGAGLFSSVMAHYFGVPKDFSKTLTTPVFFLVFMVLRDMSKQWESVLRQKANAIRGDHRKD